MPGMAFDMPGMPALQYVQHTTIFVCEDKQPDGSAGGSRIPYSGWSICIKTAGIQLYVLKLVVQNAELRQIKIFLGKSHGNGVQIMIYC